MTLRRHQQTSWIIALGVRDGERDAPPLHTAIPQDWLPYSFLRLDKRARFRIPLKYVLRSDAGHGRRRLIDRQLGCVQELRVSVFQAGRSFISSANMKRLMDRAEGT